MKKIIISNFPIRNPIKIRISNKFPIDNIKEIIFVGHEVFLDGIETKDQKLIISIQEKLIKAKYIDLPIVKVVNEDLINEISDNFGIKLIKFTTKKNKNNFNVHNESKHSYYSAPSWTKKPNYKIRLSDHPIHYTKKPIKHLYDENGPQNSFFYYEPTSGSERSLLINVEVDFFSELVNTNELILAIRIFLNKIQENANHSNT